MREFLICPQCDAFFHALEFDELLACPRCNTRLVRPGTTSEPRHVRVTLRQAGGEWWGSAVPGAGARVADTLLTRVVSVRHLAREFERLIVAGRTNDLRDAVEFYRVHARLLFRTLSRRGAPPVLDDLLDCYNVMGLLAQEYLAPPADRRVHV